MDREQPRLYKPLGRIPSGIFVVTVEREGKRSALLASWVQQCSFHPPMITLAVAPDRPIAAMLQKPGEFVLNILDESQTDMIAHFGKGFTPDQDPFADVELEQVSAPAPVLTEIVGYLVCRVTSGSEPGDHIVLVAEVIDGEVVSDGSPMVHVRKSGAHY